MSFLILIFYPLYLRWVSPPIAEPIPGERTSEPNISESVRGSTQRSSTTPTETKIAPASPGEEKLVEFSNQHFDVQFSDRGAVVTKLRIKNWSKQHVPPAVLVERDIARSKAFLATLPNQGVDFENQVFELERLDKQAGEVRFVSEVPGRWRLEKTFFFDETKPIVRLEIAAKNLDSTNQTTALELASDIHVETANQHDRYEAKVFTAAPDKLSTERFDKLVKKQHVSEGTVLWQALTKKYFAVILRPDQPAALARAYVTSKESTTLHGVLRFAPEQIAPGGVLKHEILAFAGPQYYSELKEFGYGFEQILSHGFFGVFKYWLLVALQQTHRLVGNYGWAIIIVTCLVKLLFTPFTHMSFESMRKMQAIQPKVKALQEQYKKDQAKLSQETMALYKRHKVNPMGGCLPMLLQIPVFIAFYQVLVQTVELKGAPFIFWIRDLSEPDRLLTFPFTLPFLGDGANLLPILMLGSMIWQQRLTPQVGGSPEQQKMMMLMPIVFGFIFYNLPSGLVLYWLVNNVLSIFHQLFIKGKALPHHEEA